MFDRIVGDYSSYAAPLGFQYVMPIPISARFGDNVIASSDRTPWYSNAALLQYLENVDVGSETSAGPLRFPVQWVNRPTSDFRGYAGTVVSGKVAVGDPVIVATSGRASSIKEIVTFDGPRASAEAGDAVTLTLTSEVDLARRISSPPTSFG